MLLQLQVRAGGVYFMISRTMGLEIGAAIGVLAWIGISALAAYPVAPEQAPLNTLLLLLVLSNLSTVPPTRAWH